MTATHEGQVAHFQDRDLPAHTRVVVAFAVLSAHGPVTREMALTGAGLDPDGLAPDEQKAVDELFTSGAIEEKPSGLWRITAAAQEDVVKKVDIPEATPIVEAKLGLGG